MFLDIPGNLELASHVTTQRSQKLEQRPTGYYSNSGFPPFAVSDVPSSRLSTGLFTHETAGA